MEKNSYFVYCNLYIFDDGKHWGLEIYQKCFSFCCNYYNAGYREVVLLHGVYANTI